MHVDGASLVCGLLLGGALWQGQIGVALIKRGQYRPSAWGNPDLSPRSQGWGFVLISGTFTLTGISYLVSPLARHRGPRRGDDLPPLQRANVPGVGQKPKNPGLRWRRPASPVALIASLVAGLLMLVANMTAIAAHDWRWFVVSGLAFVVFLGLVAYGLAANKARERAERLWASRATTAGREPSPDGASGEGRF